MNQNTILKYLSDQKTYAVLHVLDAAEFSVSVAQYFQAESFHVSDYADILMVFHKWLWVRSKFGYGLTLGKKRFYTDTRSVTVSDIKGNLHIEYDSGVSDYTIDDFNIAKQFEELAKEISDDLQGV